MRGLIGIATSTKLGLISGIERHSSLSWYKIIDINKDDYNLVFLGIISSYSNQKSALVLLTCQRYKGGAASVYCEKLNNAISTVKYAPKLKYKINDGRVRVWCSSSSIFISESLDYIIDAIDEVPEEDSLRFGDNSTIQIFYSGNCKLFFRTFQQPVEGESVWSAWTQI